MSDLPRDFRSQAYLLMDEKIDALQADVAAFCDSPIETAFALAFAIYSFDHFGRCSYFLGEAGEVHPSIRRVLQMQKPIGSYRVDFVASGNPIDASAVIVECDGHDFHERTKEQAARDRSRDRDLQAQGFKVFRFTGSEIYRNAFKCAEEVHQEIWRMERDAK